MKILFVLSAHGKQGSMSEKTWSHIFHQHLQEGTKNNE